MRKNEIELLNNIQKAKPTNQLLLRPPKTPQQNYLITFAAIHFVKLGHMLPTIQTVIQGDNGTFSQIVLAFHSLKHCLKSNIQLNSKTFRVYKMMISWMNKLEKLTKNQNLRLLPSVLQSQPGKLPLSHYAELIIYFSCISRDLLKLLKSPQKLLAEDLLQLFGVLLPHLHYNIILPNQDTKGKQPTFNQVLFINQQIDYFVRSCAPYRLLVLKIFKAILNLQLTPNQHRQLIDLACRYYLLFNQNKTQKAESLFLQAFQKASESVRFSLSNELMLFFKVVRKLGDLNLQNLVCQKWPTVKSLIEKFKPTVLGHTKQEVSPYNPLGIQQIVTVAAGKIDVRTIEIYHQNSLFYFQLGVQSRDVTMKVYYLGDFQSKVQIRKLLLSEQKLDDNVKSTFVATKRGLYQVELDNSYSWIYSKNIKFQYVVLAPYNHSNNPSWIDQLFELNSQIQNLEESEDEEQEQKNQSTQIQSHPIEEKQISKNATLPAEKTNIKQPQAQLTKGQSPKVQEGPPQKNKHKQSSFKENQQRVFCGQANLSLIDGIFSLLVSTAEHNYQFQTNREDRIASKLNGCIQALQQLQWITNGQAREWLQKHNYSLFFRNGGLMLTSATGRKIQRRSKLSQVFKYRS